ncbi:MAG: PAS domain-containing sensor histidine kinase, partial [bacterium]
SFAAVISVSSLALAAAILERNLAEKNLKKARWVEDELRDQSNLMKSIIDNMGEGLLVCNEKGKTLFVNPAAQVILGGQVGDPIPRSEGLKNVVSFNEDGPPILSEEFPITQTLAGQSSDNVELFIRNPLKPEGVHVLATSRPIRDGGGTIRGGVSVFRDITEQNKIQKEVQKLARVVESSRDLIVMSGPDGKSTYLNEAGRRILGIDAGVDIRSVRSENFFFEEDIPRLRELDSNVGDVSRARGYWEGEIRLKNQKTNQPVPVHFSVVYIKDPQTGKLLGSASIGRDITEQKIFFQSLKDSEERFRLLVNFVKDYAIFLLDPEGKVMTWNDGARRLKGYLDAEIIGRHFSCFYTPEDIARKHPEELLKTAKAEGRAEEEGWRVRKDGTRFWAENVLTALWDEGGTLKGFAKITRDITQRKKIDELARSNRELEQFAYVASHDLQEPLRMVSSFVQLLALDYKGRLDKTADQYIQEAVGGVKRMQALILDLLTYSRLDSGGRPFEKVDCAEALGQALADLEVGLKGSGAKVFQSALPVVKGDFNQMVQLFQNLIANAVKFKADDPPEIHVGARKEDGEWIFCARDNGIGLDPVYAEQIFEIFKRLHTRHEYPGTGIGLAICKKVVTRHGGRIWVESELGKGASFFWTLPALG